MDTDRAMQITATVIRADGTVEELGVVAEGDLEFKAAEPVEAGDLTALWTDDGTPLTGGQA